jgi:tRNA threonylcarbamoyladenosine biosynthesis protein TsaB
LKLLAIETATESCSAALAVDGDVRERFEIAPRRHAELILPMVDALLAEGSLGLGQLDCIAFGRGPGAFTGVRLAAGVAQGLAFGADLPVVPVSTLAALAQDAAPRHDRILAALDARMGEVYWGAFSRGSDGLVESAGAEQAGLPERVELPEGAGWHGAGTGWVTYGPRLAARMGQALGGWERECYPRAGGVALLAAREFRRTGGIPPEEAVPVYLRSPV